MSRRDRLLRFGPVQRYTHRTVAILGVALLATGLVLYIPSLSLLIARRPAVEGLHVLAGLLLPVPFLLALLRPAFRRDLATLNRFGPADWTWLRHRRQRGAGLATGKFNAGQKLAAAAFAAAGAIFLGTGIMLLLPTQLHLSDSLRQGATIVHDATTLAFLALLLGHVRLAYRHPEARKALRTGFVPAAYAREHYAGWAREQRDASRAGATDVTASSPRRPRKAEHRQRQ